jgi:type II secretory pathway pseudopilin PulG
MRSEPSRGERGETLIEVVASVAILGIAVTAVLGSVMASVLASQRDQSNTDGQVRLRNWGESLRAALGPMPACPTIADLPSRPADTTTVQYFYGPAVAGPGNPAIKYWNNATSAWDATCTNDTGVEAVLLRVTVTPPKSPSYDRTLWVALRRPCRVPPPPTSVPAGVFPC